MKREVDKISQDNRDLKEKVSSICSLTTLIAKRNERPFALQDRGER